MKILAIDSTQSFYSLALSIEGRIFYREFNNRNTISKNLILDIKSIIEDNKMNYNEVDYFIVNPGPGSFTGVRVAIAALQALELISNKPLYGINMFEAIAIIHREKIYSCNKVRIIIKCDNYHAYVQDIDHETNLISEIDRQNIKEIERDKIVISNDIQIPHDFLVSANAQDIAQSALYQITNNNVLTAPIPCYVY